MSKAHMVSTVETHIYKADTIADLFEALAKEAREHGWHIVSGDFHSDSYGNVVAKLTISWNSDGVYP